MDNETKLLFSRPSLELHYQNGKGTLAAYKEVNSIIEQAYTMGRITRREMNELKQINEELYSENYRG